ncbi:hypothetical protein ACJJTC_015441 [Scirpophaga incertulas]
MESRKRSYLLCVLLMCALVNGATYHVRIASERANVVDKNFVSFTVDPQHLFSSVDSGINSECSCMASLLAPAYLRIAGPSTNHMIFHNTSITIDNVEDPRGSFFQRTIKRNRQNLQISYQQWRRFVGWAQRTGFQIVFALSNGQKNENGLWDTNNTMEILSTAQKANITDIYWQLGYECMDQSIDEYLNDLETLKLMVESISSNRGLGWRVLGGDVAGCCQESKSDFKDYVTLSLNMTDAVMLDGSSSRHELAQLSAKDRESLSNKVRSSDTPLWMADGPQRQAVDTPQGHITPLRVADDSQTQSEFERAANWLSSLGYAAKNGFAVHYRELLAEELYRPSLSFYMAFLFKELVGDIALPVESYSDAAAIEIFAHCTSLRRKRVPRALTVFGVNGGEEPARVSLKLSEREEGGEIMQFILKRDDDGHIVVNGRVMAKEGDIRPVLKTVRPFKNLVINLPSKSFGFWVLANTNIEACQHLKDEQFADEKVDVTEENFDNNIDEDEAQNVRNKRSPLVCENRVSDKTVMDLTQLVDNNFLDSFDNEMYNFVKSSEEDKLTKVKRQTYEKASRKLRRQVFGPKITKSVGLRKTPVRSIIQNIIKHKLPDKTRKSLFIKKMHQNLKEKQKQESSNKNSRTKRSIVNNNHKKSVKSISHESNMDFSKENDEPWEVLNNILSRVNSVLGSSSDIEEVSEKSEGPEKSMNENDKTELSDENVSLGVNYNEIPDHGLVKNMIQKIYSIMTDFNRNLNKLCDVLASYTY